jgi:hypothetical protein
MPLQWSCERAWACTRAMSLFTLPVERSREAANATTRWLPACPPDVPEGPFN